MFRRLNALLLACCLLAITAASVRARPALPDELKKLYIVLAFDTDDENLKRSLERDEQRMIDLFKKTMPRARYEIVANLKGGNLTAKNIVATIGKLKTKVTKDDAVLFFYGGHGSHNNKLGHLLKLTNGDKDLKRETLRKQCEALNAGLVVILTDCCSTLEKADKEQIETGSMAVTRDIHPTMSHLFFRARGIVDVTAATDEAAWSDDKNGGLFTRSLYRMMLRQPKDIIKLKDEKEEELITWERFFPLLQKETESYFKEWSAVMKARYPGADIRAERQKPYAFFLGQQSHYAVVEIENGKSSLLEYKFRWEDGPAEWTTFELKPNERKAHVLMVPKGTLPGSLPRLEIERKGAGRTDKLPSILWEKPSAPTNLVKFYRIRR